MIKKWVLVVLIATVAGLSFGQAGAELVHSQNDTDNNQVMQFVPESVRSVVKLK